MKNRRALVSSVLVLLALSLGSPAAETQASARPFAIGGLEVRPGEMRAGYLAVPEKDGVGTSVPVTVLHGAKPGPVLALVAGTHGYEYPPILALYRLKTMLAPRELSGT